MTCDVRFCFRSWTGLAATGLLLLSSPIMLSGCADDTANSVAAAVEVPEFAGPWASEFSAEYQHTDSDFVRSVLADETITDEELAQTREKFTHCLTEYGHSNIIFEADGSLQFDTSTADDPDSVDEQMDECSEVSGEGAIGALHSWIRRNPQNLDEDTIMADCLVHKGVVDESYSASEYAHDAPAADFPFRDEIAGVTAFQQCNADPLCLFEQN